MALRAALLLGLTVAAKAKPVTTKPNLIFILAE